MWKKNLIYFFYSTSRVVRDRLERASIKRLVNTTSWGTKNPPSFYSEIPLVSSFYWLVHFFIFRSHVSTRLSDTYYATSTVLPLPFPTFLPAPRFMFECSGPSVV